MPGLPCFVFLLQAAVALIVIFHGSTLAFVISPSSDIRNDGIIVRFTALSSVANDGECANQQSYTTPEILGNHDGPTYVENEAPGSKVSLLSMQSPGSRPNITFPYPDLVESLQSVTIPLGKEATRVFHGRGAMFQGCENVTLDWFPPVWVLTSFHEEFSDRELSDFQQELQRSIHRSHETDGITSDTHNLNVVYQFRSSNGTKSVVVSGDVPYPHIVSENGMQFLVQLLKGQNRGIFLDMINGREWVRKHAKGLRVLNLFAYTCGFSVAAKLGGAIEVVNVDMARGALKVGQRNHELNNVTIGTRFLGHDIFKTWGKIRNLGPYGLIIVDPPSFQRNSFIAKSDYIKVIRRLPEYLEPNGLVLLCLNAPELDTDWLKVQVEEATPELQFRERVTNPTSFPAKDNERGLKVLAFQKKSDVK
jgi:23S rRNA (cytosine1962-C5)-methyltransferase